MAKSYPEVECPGCRKRGKWLDAVWGPFCSERCKLIDLGKWFDGENKISEPLRSDHFAEFEEAEGELDRPRE